MKLIYMGTGEFAISPLKGLLAAGHEIICAVCPPDKINARGKKTVPAAVKQYALSRGITLHQPERVSSAESYDYLSSLGAEAAVVCSYGQLLKENILGLFPNGCINIHSSLLPAYRGAAPMHRAIMNGEDKTGITIMYMDKGMDTGDIMLQEEYEINQRDNLGRVSAALSEIASRLICQALELVALNKAPRIKQEDEKASYADKIEKAERHMNFNKSPREVFNAIRALDPEPEAYALLSGKVIKLYDAVLWRTGERDIAPGSIFARDKEGIWVRCAGGDVLIGSLKPEGKKKMLAADFYNGLRGKEGYKFE